MYTYTMTIYTYTHPCIDIYIHAYTHLAVEYTNLVFSTLLKKVNLINLSHYETK